MPLVYSVGSPGTFGCDLFQTRPRICFPPVKLIFHPQRVFLGVAQEAGVGAVGLPEAKRHVGVGDVVDLVRARAKCQRVHDAGHVARDATATFGIHFVVRVREGNRRIGEFYMTSSTHLVGIVGEFERCKI